MNILKNRRTLDKQALERPPGGIAIALTTHCNLACKMCSVWKQREEELAHDKILSLMEEALSLGATGFYTCGTEPFTREDTPEILAYAERIGFQEICVVSNGLLLNTGQRLETLERLRNLNIVISLDGPKDVHDGLRGKGVFTSAVEALRELRQRGITCSISSVIMRQTLDRLKEIVDLAVDLGIPVISMQPYQRETAGLDNDHSRFEFRPEEEGDVDKKLRQLMMYADRKKVIVYTAGMMKYVPAYLSKGIRHVPPRGCYVPSRLMIVESTGECYPCFQISNSMKQRSMGNVHEKSLDEIWHNDIHRELIMLALNRKCPGCLAGCGDVESYNALSQGSLLSERMRHIIRRLVNSLRSS
jgi:radical SAM protein with 4Fe4S-binding SPASM domain